ncbi:MAG: response regulator [Actinobacteria bacterium]|nr:response regulator [Actinomycetota bacterium]
MDKPRILVVEDDREVLKIIALNLELEGMFVMKASDGESAIELLEKEVPDCVVLDIMLPKISGWDVLDFVNSKPDLSDVPVVMVTAKVAEKDQLRGLSQGAVKYITKPFSPSELIDAIKSALKPEAMERLVKERKDTIERIQLYTLKQISDLLLSATEVKDLLQGVARKLTILLELPFCAILLHDKDAPSLYIFTHVGKPDGQLSEARNVKYQNTSQKLKEVFSRSNQPLLLSDLQEYKLTKLFNNPEDITDGYVMPLVERGNYLGVIIIGGKSSVGSSVGEWDLLSTIANQVASAVMRARLHDNVMEDEAIRQHLLHQMITAQERERSRLAADIHDGIVQSLVGISYQLQALGKKWAAKYPGANEEITVVEKNLNNNIKELRDILHGIRPLYLEDIGLPIALESLLKDFGLRNNIQTCLLMSDELPPISKDASVNLFRITQEALNNVEKHADAFRTTVEIDANPDRLLLSISDDGKGFIERLVKGETRNLGIPGMRERAELLGGSLRIVSMPDNGTTVTLDIPLKTALEDLD